MTEENNDRSDFIREQYAQYNEHRRQLITKEVVETISLRQTQTVSLADPWANFPLKEEVRVFEERLIEPALKEAKGMVTRAARLLGFKNHAVLQARLKNRNKSLESARKPAEKRRRSIVRRQVTFLVNISSKERRKRY